LSADVLRSCVTVGAGTATITRSPQGGSDAPVGEGHAQRLARPTATRPRGASLSSARVEGYPQLNRPAAGITLTSERLEVLVMAPKRQARCRWASPLKGRHRRTSTRSLATSREEGPKERGGANAARQPHFNPEVVVVPLSLW